MKTSISVPKSPFLARRSTRLLMISALLAALAAIGIALALSDGSNAPANAAPVDATQVQTQCVAWSESSEGAVSDAQWCGDMFAWMQQNDGGSMMKSRMWSGPDQMRDACREWIDQTSDEVSSMRRQCDDMVTWMDTRMSLRNDNWMMSRS